jgi:hypothetical protein
LAKKDGPLALRLPRPGEVYWQIVSPYWDQVDIYSSGDVFLRTFANVPEPAGHLLALHWCQSEVCNGGFHQFFINSTGVLAPEAVRGFRAINMSAIAEILERAMVVFGTPYPRAREMRHQFLSSKAKSAIAEILERAMVVFGTPYPRAREMRHQFLSSISGKIHQFLSSMSDKIRDERDPFTALDDAFYEAKGGDVLYDAADAYAARTMPLEARLNLTPEPQVDGTVCYVSLG